MNLFCLIPKNVFCIQMDCDHLKQHCKELEIHATAELRDKIDKLAIDLNEKWSKKLK